jgi:hypothetical protein
VINGKHAASVCLLVAIGLLLGACALVSSPTPVREPLDVTILHTGQVYGQIGPCG